MLARSGYWQRDRTDAWSASQRGVRRLIDRRCLRGVKRENLTRLDHRLRAASSDDNELDDLELARAQLRQVQELLVRHAQRWRDRQQSDDQQQRCACSERRADVLPDPVPTPGVVGARTAVSVRPTGLVLREARGGALLLSACAIVLAVLGLTPGMQWIPEAPLLNAAVLAPVGICGVSGYRAARRAGRVLAGAVAGALAGAAGGGVGGLCYVVFGKSAFNMAACIVLGLIGGAAGALFGQRAA